MSELGTNADEPCVATAPDEPMFARQQTEVTDAVETADLYEILVRPSPPASTLVIKAGSRRTACS